MPGIPTAQNFVQVGSRTEADFAALDKALAYLSQSPSAASVLADMMERGVQVRINHDGDLSYSGGVLNWDPGKGVTTIADDGVGGGGVVSPALVFIHEGAHSIDMTLTEDQREANVQWENDAERYAGQVESDVATQLGEEVRGNHQGVIIDVPNVTQHTVVDSDGNHTWVEMGANNSEITGPQYTPAVPAPAIPDQGGDGPGVVGDSGNDAGGGDGGSGCVAINSWLPDGRRAGDIILNDFMQLADSCTLESGDGMVTYSKIKEAMGFRITTATGALLCTSPFRNKLQLIRRARQPVR